MAFIFTLTDDSADAPALVEPLVGQCGTQTVPLKFPPLAESARAQLWVLQSFRQLADAIEQTAEQGGLEQLRRAVVVVAVPKLGGLSDLDALTTTGNPRATVVALLILAFPEIHWLFRDLRGKVPEALAELHVLPADATADNVTRPYEQCFVPLFDPAGLREIVRDRVRGTIEGGRRVAAYVPLRSAVAVAIDEEPSYAYLNAYVAYRFGYRCHALTTYEGALRVLRSDAQRLIDQVNEIYDEKGSVSTGDCLKVLVHRHGEAIRQLCPNSDVAAYLKTPAFEDAAREQSSSSRAVAEQELIKKAEGHASLQGRASAGLRDVAAVLLEQYGFAVRDENWPDADGPSFVLSLEDRYLNFPDKDTEQNPRLSSQEERDRVFGRLKDIPVRFSVTTGHEKSSPLPSFLGKIGVRWHPLSQAEELPRTLYKPSSGIFDIWGKVGPQAPAEWYVWPPLPLPEGISEGGGHSAHGRLLLVAERLIARAQRILRNANSVADAVHGAVLALDAKEYLGHRTPTTSLEAIALQHQFEVLAECSFYGIEHNVNVKGRFSDIDRELVPVSDWFHPSKSKPSRLNAELRIVSELLLIFREHSQFDEEQQTLVKLRVLHRGLWLHRRRGWAIPLWPLRFYIELLLRSLGWPVAAFAFWITALTLLYVFTGHGGDPSWFDRYWHGFVDTMISFVGLSPPHDSAALWDSPGALRVCMFAFGLGFLHLGIFITHLYAILARR